MDESGRTVVKGRHLLSVRDLNLSDRIGELIDAGITSFKIEGRLKDIGYIKNVVSYYRQRIDRALASRPGFCRSSVGESRPDFQPDPSKSFTRGESEYFFDGRRAGVASFDTPKAVGEPLGRIVRVDRGSFTLSGPCDLAPGDGICLLTRNGLAGTNVNEVAGSRIVPNRMEGVVAGAEVFRKIATYCKELGVEYLTVYAFSTENWKRPADEVNTIMGLLKQYMLEAIDSMERDQIRLRFLGDMSALSPELQELARRTNEISSHIQGFQANVCLNYGGRDELLRAARHFAADCVEGRCRP